MEEFPTEESNESPWRLVSHEKKLSLSGTGITTARSNHCSERNKLLRIYEDELMCHRLIIIINGPLL
jgi:hypothetical protein